MADPKEQAKQETKAAEEAVQPTLEELISLTGTQEVGDRVVVQRGIQEFVRWMMPKRDVKINQAAVNEFIAELDRKMSSQVDEILHSEQFQKLESAWRGLKLVVDKTNFRENTKIQLLNVSKDDLLADFEDAPDITKSGLYRLVYSENYNTFGGEPVGAMVANYDFGPGPQDVRLLQSCAAVASMSHAPFLAAAGPQFFGEKDYLRLPRLKDLHSIFEGPQYAKWRSFRESEDSRSVGLAMPRFLLRLPYGSDTIPAKLFHYEEQAKGKHGAYLWGNAAFALATRLTDSFAKYRFCANIIGPSGGGAVEDLPVPLFDDAGAIEQKCPTEVPLAEDRELELANEGFIGLTWRKGSDNAAFFSANSAQKAKFFGTSKEGKAAEANYKLGTRLPYMMVVNRMAHYIKVLQREQIGSNQSRVQLEAELNKWINQFVLDQDFAPPEVFAKKPLRKAEVLVEDVEGEPGWYKVGVKVVPHFKYEGAFFELSLVGKLDKQ